MFENYKVFSTEIAGRKLVVETGKIAQLANGSCLVRYGDTVVLCCATASASPREGIDFLPLSVDFEEKLYSVGRIPGSWNRREGRPSEKAILASRVIDRPIRPRFPKDLRNDVVLSLTVMSVDPDCSPEITGMIGASIALSISDIPWNGPIAGLFMGCVDGEIVTNPTADQRERSTLELTVASSADKVVMIEAGAKEIPDDVMFSAIMKAHEETKPIIEFINSIVAEIGKPKFEYPSCEVDKELYERIAALVTEDVKVALDTDDKKVRDARLKPIYDKVYEAFGEEYPDSKGMMDECLYKLQKSIVRRWLLDDQRRVDGRRMDEIRPLASEVSVLPRTHGSGLFTRGQTQVLTVATLAPLRDQQLLDGIDEEDTKRYMHHYNMPSYSVGEARASRSPGRREIGHGALAERSLEPVLPSKEEFPYAIRLVSEVVSSNGSTSQGSVCGSTLALMDAGVPIKAPVAGISCGLITEGDRWMTMIDIQGLEDFFGDMTTRKGRFYIIDNVILPCIPAPRDDVSKYAPKMISTKIDVEKIREVIGTGGKVIQKITADTNTQIDIDDDGSVFIAAVNKDDAYRALDIINAIVFEPKPGMIFTGKVTRIIPIGAFVEFAPGKEGLVHISKLDKKRVAKVEDVVSVGDEIKVKFLDVDEKGRMNLSRKDALDS